MRGRRGALIAAAIPVLAAVPEGRAALPLGVSGTVRTATVVSAPAGSRGSDAALLNHLRIAADPVLGPLVLDVAWDLTVSVSQRGSGAIGETGAPESGAEPGPENGDWLDLRWTATAGDRVFVEHRFDRLRATWSPADDVEVSLGRQAVSWGTTLFLTPADPFMPFHPADRLRGTRRGIDALRLRYYPAPLSEIDLVVRPSRLDGQGELTALGRGLATVRSWELSAWAGAVYGDPSAAAGAAGAIGDWAVRFEGVVRKLENRSVGRAAVGLDRTLSLGVGDLGILVEYQRDGLGAARRDDVERIFASREHRRGEHQVLGRDEAALQVSFRPDPRWEVSALALWNLSLGRVLLAPGFSWSPSDEATIDAGVYFEAGERVHAGPGPPGAADDDPGPGAFLALTWYF